MIYAYKIENETIIPLGSSDTEERMVKALEMANISTEGMLVQETELVQAGGKWYLSDDDEDYKAAKAAEEEAARIASLQPTLEDRVSATEEALIAALDDQVAINEALRAENEVLNDTLLAVFDLIGDTE